MRSTNLVIFLVLLNAAAGVVTVAAPGVVNPVVGADDEIADAAGSAEDREVDRRGSTELIGSFLSVGSLIQTIAGIVFAGPEMLRNLGAPDILITGFEVVLVFIIAFDVAEAITGRQLS